MAEWCVEEATWLREDSDIAFADRSGLGGAFKFERTVLWGSDRVVPGGAPDGCTGTVVTSAMPGPAVGSVWPYRATGVRSVG